MTTDTNAPAEPEVAVEIPQDDPLDSLLNEWDDTPAETPATPPAEPTPDPMVQELYRDLIENDLNKAVDTVHANLEHLSQRPNQSLIRDWMEGKATKDPRLNRAFVDRRRNPAGWAKVVTQLSGELEKQFETKPEANSDIESAAAFVRGSSTRVTPEPEVTKQDLDRMSDQEFNAYQRKTYGI